MWAFILIYLILAAVIVALTFRKRKLYPVEITMKKYIFGGIIAVFGILLSLGLLAVLLLIVIPFIQKLLFGKGAIVFLSFIDATNQQAVIAIIVFISFFIALILFYLIIFFQNNTAVWVFYRDLKEWSFLIPDLSKPTDFSDENIGRVTKKLNIILRIFAIVSLIFFLVGHLSLLCYTKFTDNEISASSYGGFNRFTYRYEEIEKVEISISRSPNGENPVLDYFIYFNDGDEIDIGYDNLIEVHTLLKNKNATFNYLPYTRGQYNELINKYTGNRKEAYLFVLSNNPNNEPII